MGSVDDAWQVQGARARKAAGGAAAEASAALHTSSQHHAGAPRRARPHHRSSSRQGESGPTAPPAMPAANRHESKAEETRAPAKCGQPAEFGSAWSPGDAPLGAPPADGTRSASIYYSCAEDSGPDELAACIEDGPVALDWASLASRPPVAVRAAGLANCGNMCFLNAVLQALVHAPPIGAMLDALRPRLCLADGRAPILSAIASLWSAMAVPRRLSRRPSSALGFEGSGSAGRIITASNTMAARRVLSPEALLHVLASEASFHGAAQEDAGEFLGYVVDRMHEELLAVRGVLEWTLSESGRCAHGAPGDAESDGWLEVGQAGRVATARDVRQAESPVSALMYGRLRSVVRRVGARDSVTTEPFCVLALDIGGAESVAGALAAMARPEALDARQTRTLTVQRPPPLLVLLVRRVSYDARQGCGAKDARPLAYDEALEVAGRRYLLHAVVYHHGRHAAGGHYTSDVRVSRPGGHVWMHFNDASVAEEPGVGAVLSHGQSGTLQTPYLFFYLQT